MCVEQQLISYPTVIKFIPDVENLTLVGTSPTFYDSYQETANLTSPGSVDPTVEFRVWASFLSYLNHYVPHDPLYRCDSGNCIYPDFNTLAVCSECLHLENKDIQQECDDDSDSCSAQHDNLEAFAWKRAQQGAYSTIVNQTADTSIPTSIVETKTMSVNFTNWPPEYRFDSCSVKWCVQTISSNVTNSTYYETEKYSSTLFDILSNNSVLFHGTSSNNSPYSFTVSEKSQIAFKRLGDMLTGWSRSTSQEEWLHSSSLFNGIAAFATADMTVGGKHMHRHKGTPVEVMTSGMSDALRGSLDVVGLRVLRETIVRVRWWWVLYPMAMWILSAVFLVGVVIETRQNEHIVGAWGCSAIALMLWGVEEDAKERVMDWSAEGLNKKAEKVRMQLFREGEGWSMKSVNEEGMGY